MNKKKVIIGVLMAAIFVMMAFVPAVDNMHTVQSNIAIPQQQGTAYQPNNQTTPRFLLNHSDIKINTVKLQDGFMISTFINGSLSSWVIYQNNIQAGRVSVLAFSDGNFSHYSHNVNESNMKGTVNTSNMTNHTQASLATTYTPGDAKYSTCLFGWVASFSPSELWILSIALDSGAAIATIIAIFASRTIVSIPVGVMAGVAAVIMGIEDIALAILAHDCGNGGYVGATWVISPEMGCNQVPWDF